MDEKNKMNQEEKTTSITEGETCVVDEMIQYLWNMLTSFDAPQNAKLNALFAEHEMFNRLMRFLIDLRELSFSLSQGDLDKMVFSKGYVLSSLKALQANLRHLTWQTKKIAEGDFTQKVDFQGDFSTSFNEMTTKLESYHEQLSTLANYDQLTLIPNRRFLHAFLANSFARFQRDQESFLVAMFDIDFFKNINDTYGHDAGDKVLVQMSEILSKTVRASDIFARYGGEEFVAVLIHTDMLGARVIAERALHSVREANFDIGEMGEKKTVKITVSIGISQVRQGDADYNAVVKRSDQALYRAKRNGRNQIVVV